VTTTTRLSSLSGASLLDGLSTGKVGGDDRDTTYRGVGDDDMM
jgi:hypothetical protein